jgi:hypothetical protein
MLQNVGLKYCVKVLRADRVLALERNLQVNPLGDSVSHPSIIFERICAEFFDWEEPDAFASYLPRDHSVELYLVMMCFIAGVMRVRTEDLTLILMLHHAARGALHLGKDPNGHQWSSNAYEAACRTRPDLIIAIAQYWTHRALLTCFQNNRLRLFEVFYKMLAWLPRNYSAFLQWVSADEVDAYLEEGFAPSNIHVVERKRQGDLNKIQGEVLSIEFRPWHCAAESVKSAALKMRESESFPDWNTFCSEIRDDDVAIEFLFVDE